MRSFLCRVAAGFIAIGVFVGQSWAQPEPMEPVSLPITPASIGSEITAIGTTVLLVCFGVGIAFYLARKLFRRTASAVGATRIVSKPNKYRARIYHGGPTGDGIRITKR